MNEMKLDFRFADEDDSGDICDLVNRTHENEFEESGVFQFRKNVPKICLSEIQADFAGMMTKWFVFETPVPDETIVGAARFHMKHDTKVGHIDMLCATGNEIERDSILKRLVTKIEHIGYSHGLNKIVIEIPQHRTDSEEFLISHGYDELSGHIYPEDKSHELMKPTMILEFHKSLNPSTTTAGQNTGVVTYSASSTVITDGIHAISTVYESNTELLSTIESLSAAHIEDSNFKATKDGGVTLNIDDLDLPELNAGANNQVAKIGTLGASQEDTMEGLIDTLFKALHKEEVN